MARSKSSAGYPVSFNAILEVVGRDGKEVRLDATKSGMKVNSLRTSIQMFLSAVKKEKEVGGEFGPNAYRAGLAEKVLVRTVGDEVVMVHRDFDVVGQLVGDAIAAVGGSVACHEGPLEGSTAISADVIGGTAPRGVVENPMWGGSGQSGLMLHRAHGGPASGAPRSQPSPAVAQWKEQQEVAPKSLLDLVSAETPPQAPGDGADLKYVRKDGREVPLAEDGEPLWGFDEATGEPKTNQFF